MRAMPVSRADIGGRSTPSRWVARARSTGVNPTVLALAIGIAAAVAIRFALLPANGYRYDMDGFVLWVHGLTVRPLGEAYRQDISFPPVMVYVWAALAAVDPAFRLATDATDAGIRATMKIPGSLADLAMAATVLYALRDRPRWGVAAALGIALHPAVIWVSALWGQYDSLYVLAAMLSLVLVVNDHPVPAAMMLAVSVMTKPQALPFLVPFAAWYLARYGPRVTLTSVAAGLAVIVALWLPFVPSGGPGAYLANLSHYQDELFAALSMRAWNAWWFLQQLAGGGFSTDSSLLLGPISARMAGLMLAGLGEAAVFAMVWRRPTPRVLALGLACATLVAFCFLTTMHERYAYGAVVFLAVLVPEARIRWMWLALSVLFTLNVVAAIPTQELGTLLPSDGAVGAAGSLAMVALTGLLLWTLARAGSAPMRAVLRADGRPDASFAAA